MISLENIVFYNTKNFFSFEIKNFIPDSLYDELNNDFPNFYELKRQNEDFNYNEDNKYNINKTCSVYHKIRSKSLNFFLREIEKKEFYDEIMKKIFFKILISRIANIYDLLRILKPVQLIEYKDKQFNIFKKFFYKHVLMSHQFSFITNGGKLDPHTDSRSKLCSLMLYFPDKKNLSNLEKQKENLIGTEFWNSKIKNYENNSFKNYQNIFYNNSELAVTTPFTGPSLFGFIKNDRSWHSVKEFNINPEYVRRSININLSCRL